MRASVTAVICVALGVGGCAGGGDTDNGGGKGGSSGSGASGGSGGKGGSGGSGASGGTGAAGTGGTGATAATGGTGGKPVEPPPYDTHSLDRLQCGFAKGALTTETIGTDVPHGDSLPFNHIVVLMLENRSFDHYYSGLPAYGVTDVDVATDANYNIDPTTGEKINRFKETRYCILDTDHDWDPVHEQWNLGANDGFVKTNNPGGARAMGYYTDVDFPWYYWLSKTYAISDRHFCSLLGPTWPNRFFFYAATSWGNTKTTTVDPVADPAYKTEPRITDLMTTAGRSWKIYRDGLESFATLFGFTAENLGFQMAQFNTDVANDALPELSIVDPSFGGFNQEDEHPPSNVQLGQKFVSTVYATLTSNPKVWQKTVFIVLYDEHGGYYDHVSPPQACEPDNYVPPTYSFGRLGFRTPLIVVSPFVKAGYVSHFTSDITSITRFIENRFDLPAMTARDANAWPILDMFDFANPSYSTAPGGAPSADPADLGIQWCQNNDPGTGKP